MGSVMPDEAAFRAFAAAADGADDGPVVMINLLRYRERADYPSDFDAEPCSGREAYVRYSAVAARTIQKTGGQVRWAGEVVASVIAPSGETWDDAVLVEYPSRRAFLEMLALPEYQAGVPHRTAALEDSRLIATHTRPGLLED